MTSRDADAVVAVIDGFRSEIAGGADFIDRLIIGRSYLGEGNYEQAHACAEEARQLAPRNPRPVILLAQMRGLDTA